MRLLAQHKSRNYDDFSKLLRLLIVSLWIPLAAAKHYECDWDPLGERSPEKAGFEQLCTARPTDTVSGSPPTAYYCNVNGGFGQRQYIVAGYNTVQGELEFGPPPCDKDPRRAYGTPGGRCRARTWLVCAIGASKFLIEDSPKCFGLNRHDDCALREAFDRAPVRISIWYKKDGT